MKRFRFSGKWIKIPLIAALSLVALVFAALVTVQIVFTPERCASLVKKYAPEYIDGEVRASSIGISIFSHFPAVSANLEDMAVTYTSRDGSLDTLASFDRFTAAINIFDLVRGVVNVKKLELIRPVLSVYYYMDGTSNLDILKFQMDSSETEEDTLSVLPPILVRKVRVAEGVHLVYSDERDTLRASLRLQNFSFDGRLFTAKPMRSRGSLKVDSLLVYGHKGVDSLLFHLDHFHADGKKGDFDIDAAAKAYAATYAFGRIKIPFAMRGSVAVSKDDEDIWSASCRDVNIELATVEAEMNMDIRLADRIGLGGNFRIPDLDLQKLLGNYAVNFFSEAARFKTDAHISLGVDLDGEYDTATGELPAFDLFVDIDKCHISHPDFPVKPELELHAKADAGQGGPVHAEVGKLDISFNGFNFSSSCTAEDLLGGKSEVNASAKLAADLTALGREVENQLQMQVSGNLGADLKGRLNPASFSLYDPRTFDIKGSANLTGLTVRSFDNSLDVFVDSLKFKLAMMDDRFAISSTSGDKVLGAAVKIDSLRCNYRDSMNLAGKDILLLAQSAPKVVRTAAGTEYNPLNVMVSLGSVRVEGTDSLALRIKDSKNSARISPDAASASQVISVRSLNSGIMARSGANRVFLKNLNFIADAKSASKRLSSKRAPIKRRRMDSTAFKPKRWMQEIDFRKADISLDIDETFKKYFSEWNFRGTLELGRGGVVTPAFPLRTTLSGFKGSISNNKVAIDTLHIVSGASDVYAKGSLSNLRSAIFRNGTMKLDVEVRTDSLALTEMLAAYAAGQKNMQTDLAYLAELDDAAFENEVVSEPLDTAAASGVLLVVPANLDADIRLHGKGIQYSKLDITDMNANLLMKQRCLRLSDLKAVTTVGNLYADAFYSTLSKQEIYAGYNVEFEDIAVGDVIDLVPDIDTIMPLLKSFDGKVNCFLAATSQVDTNMNVVFPSMEGVARITGTDLHFNDCKEIRRLGRLLLFKNPRRATVDTLLMEGLLKDNSLEIFPFLLKIDRWTLAVAGIHNMDQSFSYHVSLAKTPLLIKLGANITGEDFDHAKFRLGRARYRNAKSIPSFSTLIDTTRMNLVESINHVFERGVKRAVADNNERRKLIEKVRSESGYARSAALDSIEVLSSGEQMEIDSLAAVPDSLALSQAVPILQNRDSTVRQ